MTGVGGPGGWQARAAQVARRLAAWPHRQALTGCLLGLLALTEQVARLTVRAARLAVHAPAARAAVAGAAPHVTRAASTVTDAQTATVVCLLALATTVPLAFLPAAAAAVAVCAAAVLSLAAFGTLTAAGLAAVLIVLYRLGRTGSPVPAPALALPFVVMALSPPVSGGRVLSVLTASLAPAAALAGIARRARAEAAEHGAARQVIAGSLVEHTARGERARIARELHDVVAHHISMVAVQAETARLATPGMPPAGAEQLSAIGDTARAALTEMRRLLGVLRDDARAATPGRPGPERQPQPGLRELNELLDAARDASGTPARLILRGPPAALDPGTELAAYRIVQEALTNARRHAPGAAVDVELHYAGEVLRLRIRDNGPGPPAAPAGGHGLAGMRERAAAAGGELSTGPAPGGGFLVEAVLPVKTEAAA